MLLNLLLLPLHFLVLLGWGRLFCFRRSGDFVMEIFLGGAVISIIALVYSFFSPLDIFFGWTICILGIILGIWGLWQRGFSRIDFPPKNLIGLFCILLIASALLPVVVDQMGYYLPTIEFLKTFGTIKGMASLELTQGQLSLWHYLEASLPVDFYLRLNFLFTLLFIADAFYTRGWPLLVGTPIFIFFISSASPDSPGILVSIWIIHRLRIGKYVPGVLFFLSAWLIGIKPILFWPMIVVILYLILKKEFYIIQFIPGLCILGIIIFKNIYVFGYPVFPLAIFPFSENIPDARLMRLSSEMASIKALDMQHSFIQIQRMAFYEKIFSWLHLGGIKSVIHYGLVFCGIFYLFLWKKHKTLLFRLSSICIGVKLLLVLWISAQYRFFIDFFLLTAYWGLGIWMSASVKWRFTWISTLIITIFLAFPQFLTNLFRPARFITHIKVENLIHPAYFVHTPPLKCKIGNLDFYTSPRFPFLLDTPSPAISPATLRSYNKLGIFPQWEENGIIQRPLTNNQKKKLEIILNKLKY